MTSRSPVEAYRAGRGRPRVLLHGFTGAAVSWRRVAGALGGPEPIVALHVPGHHPAVPVESGGFEANLPALLAQLDAAGIDRAALIGYSLGARVALGVAVSAPERVASLVLIGGHPGLTSEDARVARRAADAERASLLRDEGLRAFVDRWERLPLFASQRQLDPELLAEQRRIRLGHDAAALADSLEQLGLGQMPCYRDWLRAPSVPVTLITGELDPKFNQLARELAAVGSGVRHRMVAGAGHNLPLEAPEMLAQIVETSKA